MICQRKARGDRSCQRFLGGTGHDEKLRTASCSARALEHGAQSREDHQRVHRFRNPQQLEPTTAGGHRLSMSAGRDACPAVSSQSHAKNVIDSCFMMLSMAERIPAAGRGRESPVGSTPFDSLPRSAAVWRAVARGVRGTRVHTVTFLPAGPSRLWYPRRAATGLNGRPHRVIGPTGSYRCVCRARTPTCLGPLS